MTTAGGPRPRLHPTRCSPPRTRLRNRQLELGTDTPVGVLPSGESSVLAIYEASRSHAPLTHYILLAPISSTGVAATTWQVQCEQNKAMVE